MDQIDHMDTNSLAHCCYDCKYPIVIVPKYRRQIFFGTIKDDIRACIKTLCKCKNVEIIDGTVCKDHVHLLMNDCPLDCLT